MHNHLGNVLLAEGRASDAEESYRRAVLLQPRGARLHENLGTALWAQRRLEDAEVELRAAVALQADLADAHGKLGGVLVDLSRFDEAEQSLKKSLSLKPQAPEVRSGLIFSRHYRGDDVGLHRDESVRFGEFVAKQRSFVFTEWKHAPSPETLRVGLVSGDFTSHPTGYFLEALLAHADRSRVEFYAYANQATGDQLTLRLQQHFAKWTSIHGRPDDVVARTIHDDGVHILIDASGHTSRNRLPVFAYRPAPLQASWLGYFATTGVSEIDYLIGDPYVTPWAEQPHFTEKIWQLPDTYLCFTPPDAPLDVAPLPALKNGHVTFGCFNKTTKLNDRVVALWSRILAAVPDARLFLKAKELGQPSVVENLRRRFAAHGVADERLILEGPSPRLDYFSAYDRVDLALDPFPYPGGTTSTEGLWMGVPVVTMRGTRFLSHLGECVAHNSGQAAWVARDDDDYLQKAVAFAADVPALARLRQGLRAQVLASPLFDGPRFARAFEDAMGRMWRRRR
jgi:predicted O-linked N-acetylglucosamine transferase (SPINDLY family)